MKKILLAFVAMVCGMSMIAQVVRILKGDEIVRDYTAEEFDKVVFVDVPHDYVDLGLSVKWATCNVGASSMYQSGSHFAWGETAGKNYTFTYDFSNYKYYNGKILTKYCTNSYSGIVDNKTVLDPEDDVATAKWGGDWRMPTKEELEELVNNCTWTWDEYAYCCGYKVTGKNGNSIFLPAAGYRRYDERYDECGFYWSSTLNTYNNLDAHSLTFDDSGISNYHNYQIFGATVRPVCP